MSQAEESKALKGHEALARKFGNMFSQHLALNFQSSCDVTPSSHPNQLAHVSAHVILLTPSLLQVLKSIISLEGKASDDASKVKEAAAADTKANEEKENTESGKKNRNKHPPIPRT